jgi:hypothetical protein
MTGDDRHSSADLQAAGSQGHRILRFEGSPFGWRGAAECQVEQDFEVTPVGGFAALAVGRSTEPKSPTADQDGAPTTDTLSGPVTLTAIISRAAQSWVPTPASNPFAIISTGASPTWSSKRWWARRSDRPHNEQFFPSGSTHASPCKAVAAQRRL